MFQFIESIKLQDGILENLIWHQKRVNETYKKFYKNYKPLNLSAFYDSNLPQFGLYKVRVQYNSQDFEIEFLPYQKKEIKTFSIAEIDFEYHFKFLDRSKINKVKKAYNSVEIIFCRNNFILDSSYSNLAFLSENQWFTPSTFLLNGTTRQRLIAEKKIQVKDIFITDIAKYQKISFINALNDLGENTLDLF